MSIDEPPRPHFQVRRNGLRTVMVDEFDAMVWPYGADRAADAICQRLRVEVSG